MVKILQGCLVALSTLLLQAQAAVLQVDGGGALRGATGVLVGTKLYDVEFVGGTCQEAFSPCNLGMAFTFDTAGAALASQSLLDQVFVDGPDGSFDSDQHLTFGCVGGSTECVIFTPVVVREAPILAPGKIVVEISAVMNVRDPGTPKPPYDNLFSLPNPNWVIQPTDPTGLRCVDPPNCFDRPGSVWAKWSPASIPEPGTLALLGLGLAGLAATRRRKQ
jgi:hypothetical protein